MGHAALILAAHLLRRAPRATRPARQPIGVVLVYHAVYDPSQPLHGHYAIPADRFAVELAALEEAGYHFVSAQDFVGMLEGRLAPRPGSVLLTFDDGLACDLTVVTPILERFHAPAVAFLIGDRIGRPGYLTAAQIRAMVRTGLWTFGSHTYGLHSDHEGQPWLIYLTREPDTGPLLAGDVRLEDATFRALDLPKPRLFAFPFGAFDETAIQLLRHDYAFLFTSEAGAAYPGETLVPRLNAGFYNVTPGRLVLLVHQYDPLTVVRGNGPRPGRDREANDLS